MDATATVVLVGGNEKSTMSAPRRRKRVKLTVARAKAFALIKKVRPVHGLRASPVEVDFAIPVEESTSYRFFDCQKYDVCLHIACIGKWRGFTCRACPVAEKFGERWSRILRRSESDK